MRKRHLSQLFAVLALTLCSSAAGAGEYVTEAFTHVGDDRLRYARHEEGSDFRRRDDYRDDDRHAPRHRDAPLVSLGSFRTRERGVRDTTVGLPDGTEFVQVLGTRRALFVHRAIVRFDDGRSQRLRRLEGYIAHGDVISSRLRDCIGGVLYLQTSPADRGRRGYGEILVGVTPPRRRDW